MAQSRLKSDVTPCGVDNSWAASCRGQGIRQSRKLGKATGDWPDLGELRSQRHIVNRRVNCPLPSSRAWQSKCVSQREVVSGFIIMEMGLQGSEVPASVRVDLFLVTFYDRSWNPGPRNTDSLRSPFWLPPAVCETVLCQKEGLKAPLYPGCLYTRHSRPPCQH